MRMEGKNEKLRRGTREEREKWRRTRAKLKWKLFEANAMSAISLSKHKLDTDKAMTLIHMDKHKTDPQVGDKRGATDDIQNDIHGVEAVAEATGFVNSSEVSMATDVVNSVASDEHAAEHVLSSLFRR